MFSSHAFRLGISWPSSIDILRSSVLSVDQRPPTARSPYPHTSLVGKKNEIRLIKLCMPVDGQPLQCEIAHANLDEVKTYVALSYVWGSLPATQLIHVGTDHFLRITPSLEQALRDVRKFFRSESTKESQLNPWVWADGICIDQANVDEKEEQIPLMGQIYSNAWNVLVYTGPGVSTGAGFDAFVREIIGTALQRQQDDNPLGHLRMDKKEWPTLGLPPADDPNWQILAEFMAREWCSRAWILQEVLLSTFRRWLLYGPYLFDLRLLAVIPLLISRDYLPTISHGLDRSKAERDQTLMLLSIVKERMLKMNRTHIMTLEGLLYTFPTARCTDPRDIIYCFSNLASDWKSLQIPINYSITVEQLFITTACRMINISCSYRILHHVSEKGLDLPSWVPDWAHLSGTLPLTDDSAPGIERSEVYGYAAGGTDDAGATADEGSKTLSVRASIIDQLCFIAKAEELLAPPAETGRPTSWSEWLGTHSEKMQPGHRYKTSKEVIEASWLTLVGGMMKDEKATVQNSERYFKAWARSTDDPERLDIATATDAVEVIKMLKTFVKGRSWTRTLDDRMGLVPVSTQMGDLIAIIPGLKTPFVLRKAEGGYLLIGECYVHGIMDGELIEAGDLIFEKIVLV